MKNIKFVSIFMLVFCALSITYDTLSMQDITSRNTRYVVRDSWVKKHANDAIEKIVVNFNTMLARIRAELETERDKKSDKAQYLTLRLQIMKAISDRIVHCFVTKLQALDNGKTAVELLGEFEADYVRNDAIEIPVNPAITTFITEFLPCDLITAKKYFDLVQTKTITIKGKYYILEDDNLPQFNRYASWLEALAVAIFGKSISAENVDNTLAALQSLGLKTAVFQLIKDPREKFIKETFPEIIKHHLDRIARETQELASNTKEGASASRFILILKKLIQFNDPAFHKFINESINSNNNLKTMYQKVKDLLYQILHGKYKLSYQKIDSYTQEKYKEFGLQYADFLNYYNEINQNPAKSQAEIDILVDHIEAYIAKIRPQGDNLHKLQALLNDIKVLKGSIQTSKPLKNAFELLMSLQLGLRTLQALKK